MAQIIKLLAKSKPGAATPTNLYVVPNKGNARIQGLMVCNEAGADSFRVSISPLGAATDVADYLYYDIPISANNTFLVELDLDLEVSDTIRVYSTNGNCSFNLFGGVS